MGWLHSTPRSSPGIRLALAASLVAGLAVGLSADDSVRDQAQDLAELRAEYDQLRRELDAMRSPSPVRMVVPRDAAPDVYINLRPLHGALRVGTGPTPRFSPREVSP